jgi:hypothetical protein
LLGGGMPGGEFWHGHDRVRIFRLNAKIGR